LRRLVIVSASQRRVLDPNPIPAIERFDGVYFRILRKYLREGKMKDVSILVVSDRYGILEANDLVPFHPASDKTKEVTQDMWASNLAKLKETFKKTSYSEIYVVCGQKFQAFIKGFEDFTNVPVTYCYGRGLGPKARSLKDWIFAHSN
jgi:cytoplasmic iron level regulating protein YaaA (DUF328/UPF0246 family)